MSPSRPLIDLATESFPYNSNDTNTLFFILGVWFFGLLLLYVAKGGFNDELNYVAIMAVITPTLTIGFSSGLLFWSLLLMTVINIFILMMKKTNIVTFITYNYYLTKSRFRSIESEFLININNVNKNSIKTIQRCYMDAYYEKYILPSELEEHDRLIEEYLSQAPMVESKHHD